MSPAIVSLLIQLVSGAGGGNVVGALLKKLPVSKILATILGAVGGAGGAQLAAYLPMLEGLLSGGGVAGDVGVGAGGGALLTLIAGLIKKAMSGPSAGDNT